MNIHDFHSRKQLGKKISMVTCYDFWSAKILNESDVDCLLVGDSVAMVMHGYPSTLSATPEMLALHTAAVARGATEKFIVSDMPFPTFQSGTERAMDCVDQLMKAGAHAVKLEGVDGHELVVRNIVSSGVPVMGHLGLTPQSTHMLGGFKVQGREQKAKDLLLEQSKKLQDLGCFAIVLECVPADLATLITESLHIPTIGIGAGPHTDGQVLVLHDLLGVDKNFKPKFLKQFLNGHSEVLSAVNAYHNEVTTRQFPTEKESYL